MSKREKIRWCSIEKMKWIKENELQTSGKFMYLFKYYA